MHLDSAQLTALAHILRLGSFDAAAAVLGVTPSAISQRVKALEDRVGATLVLRGQPCTGTPMGQRLAKHAEDVALLEAQAQDRVGEFDVDAEVTLMVPRYAAFLPHVATGGRRGHLAVWAEVETDQPLVEHTLHVVEDGTDATAAFAAAEQYLGSCKVGLIVWHVYDAGQSSADVESGQ